MIYHALTRPIAGRVTSILHTSWFYYGRQLIASSALWRTDITFITSDRE